MAAVNLPPCPQSLHSVQHYIKLASDYDKRQPVLSYWARLYALQTSLKLDRKSPEARALLTGLMDYLENFKKEHADDESVTNDVAGQALVENMAHKLFMWADGEDRAARFNKNVVKVFYTAGLMFDVCEVFGELTDEVISQRKYAKWKATYIHNCLKKGETPIPGPLGGDDEGLGEDVVGEGQPENASGGASSSGLGWSAPSQPEFSLPSVPGASNSTGLPSISSSSPPPASAPGMSHPGHPGVPPASYSHPQVPQNVPAQPPASNAYQLPTQPKGGAKLGPEMISKAQKYCKWAVSALDYEDSTTAISNLQKALNLLTTGKDS